MIFGWFPEAAPERVVSPPLRRRLLRESLAPLSGAGFGRGGPPQWAALRILNEPRRPKTHIRRPFFALYISATFDPAALYLHIEH